MSFEKVTVVAGGGMVYDEWESVTVTHEYTSPITFIMLETTEVMDRAWERKVDDDWVKWYFPPATDIRVYGSLTGSDGQRHGPRIPQEPPTGLPKIPPPLTRPIDQNLLLAAGIVDDYMPSATPQAHKVKIRARSGASHGVDYSVRTMGDVTGTYRNLMYPDFIRKIWGSYLPSSVFDPTLYGKKIDYHQIRQGATPYQETQRIAPAYGVFTRSKREDGGIHFSKGESVIHSGGYLIQGANIISMSAKLTAFPRAQTYHVIGQSPVGNTLSDIQAQALEHDPAAPLSDSYRKYILGGIPRQDLLDDAATYYRKVSFYNAVTARIQVPGWRIWTMDDNQNLVWTNAYWDTGTLVYVYSKYLKIDCDMVISKLEFHQDSKSGTTTTIEITDPKSIISHAAVQPGPCNNASVWNYNPPPKKKEEEEEVPPILRPPRRQQR